MYTLKEVTVHNKTKYEIVYTKGEKHIAYINDRGEALALMRCLKQIGEKK